MIVRRPASLLVALAASSALAGPAAAAAAFIPPPPNRHVARIAIAPPQTVYPLGRRFIVAGSDSAWVRDRLLTRGADYFLDAIAGEFRLNRELAAGDTVRLAYRALLVPPPTSYLGLAARPLLPTGPAPPPGTTPRDTARVPALRPGAGTATYAAGPGGPALDLAGTKSVALDFGSTRDVALRQSLDLNVRGRLSDTVELLGVLSDRNTPLTTEGGTRELAELDRILLEVKGPSAGGVLGDWTLRQERGEFARVSRELTGVEARGGGETLGARAALASVKGRFVSRQFQGSEGLQGPYPLPDDDGRSVPIVVGSEEVWLDGVRLARGEAADYAMDYDRGTITFSARRLVSAASRIAVDYQVSLTAYRRTLSAFGGQAKKGGLTAYGQFLREGDAATRPLTFTLDESDRYALENAPDSATFAIGSGVAPGPGDYDGVIDTSGITRFAFAGVGLGDFQVTFTSVGAAQGDYAESTQFAGRVAYRYVGPGQGSFIIGRRLPLPTSLSVLDGGLSFAPVPWARIEGELAQSTAKSNTLSLTGTARDGTAGSARAEAMGPVRLFGRGIGRVGAILSLRRFDEDFEAPGRLDPAFAEEDWGAPGDTPLTAQDRTSGALTWAPAPRVEIGAELARLDADTDFSARRRRATLRATGRLGLTGRIEHVDNSRDDAPPGTNREGFRNKAMLAATWGGWRRIVPQASIDFDDRVSPGYSDSAAVHYRAWSVGATAPALGPFDLTANFGLRHDATREAGQWLPFTRSANGRVATTARLGGDVTAALGLERRVRNPEADDAPPQQSTDLGYARLRQPFGPRAGDHEVSFEWTGEAIEERLREVRFVGDDAGAYDSLGNFVGRGDYDVVLVATGNFDRIVRTSGSYRLDLRPAAGLDPATSRGRLLGDLRLALLVQASEGRRGGFTLADLLYTPKRLLTREDVVFGTYVIRPEVSFGGRTRYAQVLLRLERRSSADRQFAGVATTRDEWSEEARWRTRPDPRWLTEVVLRGTQGTSVQVVPGFPSVERRLTTQAASGELTWLPAPPWRVGVTAGLDRAELEGDAADPTRVLRVGPRITWTQGGRWRVETLVRHAWTSGGSLPALVPSGFPVFPDSWDYTVETSVRVRERVSVVLSGTGRKPVERTFVHTGRAELRAAF